MLRPRWRHGGLRARLHHQMYKLRFLIDKIKKKEKTRTTKNKANVFAKQNRTNMCTWFDFPMPSSFFVLMGSTWTFTFKAYKGRGGEIRNQDETKLKTMEKGIA